MAACKDAKTGENPRTVLRGYDSQEVGPHWLRISSPRQYLKQLRAYCDIYFGESVENDRGYNSFDVRYYWPNGVSLSYDSNWEKSESKHHGLVSLDVPGAVLDDMEPESCRMFFLGLRKYDAKATRLDIYFDDSQRLITPSKLQKLIKKNDFTGFRKGGNIQINKSGRMIHDEADFGARGKSGSGKYLRIYDKALESDGSKDVIRYEIELTKEHANKAFDLLSQMGSVESLAQVCGELVVGAISFVKRTGEKNIGRLKVYKFWKQIKKRLGSVVIRIPIKHTTIEAMFKFIEKQAIRTIAVLRGTFISDVDFLNWQFARLTDAEFCLSPYQRNLIKANRRSTRYDDGLIFDDERC